jgi:hypothetical protein
MNKDLASLPVDHEQGEDRFTKRKMNTEGKLATFMVPFC